MLLKSRAEYKGVDDGREKGSLRALIFYPSYYCETLISKHGVGS